MEETLVTLANLTENFERGYINNLAQYFIFETQMTSVEDALLKFENSSKIYSRSNTQ